METPLPVPAAGQEVSALECAHHLFARADRAIAGRLEALGASGRPVSCRPGCAACCRQLVAVSPLEALAIRTFLAGHPEAAAAAHARAERLHSQVAASPQLQQTLQRFRAAGGNLPDHEGGNLEALYWRAGLACPFLAAVPGGALCSIYPVRPFNCREHFVTSNPELCSLDPDATTAAATRMEYRTVAARVGAACYGLKDELILIGDLAAGGDGPRHPAPPVDGAQLDVAIETAVRQVRLALARLAWANQHSSPQPPQGSQGEQGSAS